MWKRAFTTCVERPCTSGRTWRHNIALWERPITVVSSSYSCRYNNNETKNKLTSGVRGECVLSNAFLAYPKKRLSRRMILAHLRQYPQKAGFQSIKCPYYLWKGMNNLWFSWSRLFASSFRPAQTGLFHCEQSLAWRCDEETIYAIHREALRAD